jgi:hypothetical protein
MSGATTTTTSSGWETSEAMGDWDVPADGEWHTVDSSNTTDESGWETTGDWEVTDEW